MSIKEPAPVSPAKFVRLKGVTGTGHCVHAITFATRSPNSRFQSVSAVSRSNLLIEGEITGPERYCADVARTIRRQTGGS